MAEYTVAHDEFEGAGRLLPSRPRRDAVLLRLGFGPESLEKRVRVVFRWANRPGSRLGENWSLTRPDLLILDEPTNHLDIARDRMAWKGFP